jgi:hypothetical protein
MGWLGQGREAARARTVPRCPGAWDAIPLGLVGRRVGRSARCSWDLFGEGLLGERGSSREGGLVRRCVGTCSGRQAASGRGEQLRCEQ